MNVLLYPIGTQLLTLHIKQTAKKNIILRAHDSSSLNMSIPPWLRQKDLLRWLDNNHPLLLHALQQTPPRNSSHNKLPETLWFMGQPYCVQTAAIEQLIFKPEHQQIRLPENWTNEEQRTTLRQTLFQAAQQHLLPKLNHHATQLNLNPAAIALSSAKTFWGVCRARTGIRLNWRLIGAPDWVQDYVCIHELCHLPHPNHSPAFWAAVHRATPHTEAAKSWLKTHGPDLFALDG